MKYMDALEIIRNPLSYPQGYLVSFEWREDGMLRSDHFPDVHGGEPPLPTEKEAWMLATKFALATRGKTCNLYVIEYPSFTPVKGYESKKISNR